MASGQGSPPAGMALPLAGIWGLAASLAQNPQGMPGFRKRATRAYKHQLQRRVRQLLASRLRVHAKVQALAERVTQLEAVVLLLGKMVPKPAP
eukprot:3981043-Prorocentrum_lima.AAC.1